MNPWEAAGLEFDADAFCGKARLFPLPNLVLYPHVMQPLHIYEGRYREMLEDSLAGDRLIAMALLEPGWEPDYESRPPVVPYACLGKVVTHHRLPDGRYNLLLMGVARVRIVRELDPLRSFRQASVELIRDDFANATESRLDELRGKLMASFQKHLPCGCQAPDQFRELIAKHLPLGIMTDLAAYALPLDLAIKQQLLAECRVDVCAQMLLEHLEAQQPGEPAGVIADMFPPPFSLN